VLELRGLTRRYGDLVALDDLSFTVAEGQMFGFVGPNGAGKTTAIRIVLGVLEPDAGQVLWRGSPIDEQTLPEDHGQPSASSASRLNTHQPIHLVAAVRPSATRGKGSLRSRFGVGRWL
jgi:ABC-type branched-subunit amino acid transport system ATPase component